MLDASRGVFVLFATCALFALNSGGTLIPHRLGLFFPLPKKVGEESDQNEEFLTGGRFELSVCCWEISLHQILTIVTGSEQSYVYDLTKSVS